MKEISVKNKRFIKFGIIGMLALLSALAIAFAAKGFADNKKAVYAESAPQSEYVVEEEEKFFSKYNIESAEWNEYSDGQLQELQKLTSDLNLKNELLRKTEGLSMGGRQMDSWDEDIFKYIPETVLIRSGKSAYIGQEYGFVFSAIDYKKSYDETLNAYVRYEYNEEKNKTEKLPYVFDPAYCDLEMWLIIFSIDRELVDGKYKVKSTILFNSDCGRIVRYRNEESLNRTYFKNSKSLWSIADPSISVSVQNKYGNFNSNDYGIGIFQARNNFKGYSGIKTNEYQPAYEVKTSIISPSKIAENAKQVDLSGIDKTGLIVNNVLDWAEIAGKSTISILELTTILSAFSPYIAVANIAVDVVSQIVETINDNAVKFDTAYANNEDNILTFPHPSQGLTKDVITSFGINTKYNIDNETVEFKDFNFPDGVDNPNLVLAEYGHYAESIFEFTDVNAPTVLTSSFTASFALDKSYGGVSDIKKFNIPQRFNYSHKSVNLFDDRANERITEGVVDNIAYFNESERKISLNVSQSGNYDLNLADVTPIAKFNNKMTAESEVSGMYMPVDLKNNKIGQKIYLRIEDISKNVFKNPTQYIDISSGNAKVNLYLFAGSENSLKFSLTDIADDNYDMNFVGASFSANLHKHYEEIECNGQAQSLDFNEKDWGYYSVTSGETGIYRISVENAEFSLYDPMFYMLNDKQQSAEIIMSANQTYYICAKRIDGGRLATAKFEKISEATAFDSGNEKKFEFDLSENKNSQIYAVRIGRTGIYTFNYDTGKDAAYSLQVKDGSLREYLFGIKKVYLTAGDYYFVFRNNGTGETGGEITVEFTPQQITTEKVKTVESETYFSFIPPLSGYYTLNLSNGNFAAEAEGFAVNGENRYYLNAGQRYIIKIAKNVAGSANANFSVSFTPSAKVTYHQNFNDKAAEFTTDITGQYSFNGENIALYNKELVLIRCGGKEGFGCNLTAGEKYFIINSGNKDCIVNLEGEKITANFEATISEGEKYLKFIAPEDGYYKIKAKYGTAFEVYAYNNLSSHTAEPLTDDGYYLSKGCAYYIKAYLPKPDFITVYNGSITALTEIPEGTFAEVDLNGEVNYAASYKFVPAATGDYTFIFSRNLKKSFKIFIDGSEFTFENGSNVLKITKSLNAGNTYEITFNLTGGEEGTLIFGVYRYIKDYNVYVNDKLQGNDGAVNKIAIGGDKSGEVNAQISICDIDGVAAYTKVNYKLLNVPILENGASGVRIDGNGYLTVSNSLPQWTAFAVEVNAGRVQYGDIVLDGGVSKVINFLIYVDVEDIKILDEENRVVYYIDVAPKDTVNLTAAVFPSHAFKAESLTYEFLDSDGNKYVELKPDGYNAEVTVLPTAPNKTYVRIVAKCGDEFAVVITVRVSAKVINVAAGYNRITLNDNTISAYEIVLNGNIAHSTITVPAYVDYLKIRKGSGNVMTSVAIKVESDNLTLVLESVELHGIINAEGHNLDLHFIGDVNLYGASGSYHDGSADGESVISASNLKITKADNHWVEITAGNGYSSLNSEKRVGNGGIAINCTGTVELINAAYLKINGGRGADGVSGGSGAPPSVMNPVQAPQKTNGTDGESGGDGTDGIPGGNGGAAIKCGSLKIFGGKEVYICGGDGGNGGAGGNGADGGNGGKGGHSYVGDAGRGGIGGNGGHGGRGGNGGNGSVAVSADEVTIDDGAELKKIFKAGNGGNAGAGGDGGNGGHGGEGGDDTNPVGKEGPGGRGGHGGNAGSAGDVGSQGGFVTIKDFNDQDYYNMIAADGFEALRGYMGLGGAGGRRGDKGSKDDGVEAVAKNGDDGDGRAR